LETGRALCWLWVAASGTVVAFLIHARRSAAALKALLGEVAAGVVCSGRWSSYTGLSLTWRPVCWAHLKGGFQKCVDRGGQATAAGEAGLAVVEAVFQERHRFRGPRLRDGSPRLHAKPAAAPGRLESGRTAGTGLFAAESPRR